jgi:uncharacterized protein YggU (UPF0235/DUF167 family)
VAIVEVAVQVTPRADADRVGPYAGGLLRVRVTRPPADGEANRAVIRLVAGALGVPPSTLTLVAGARSRTKRYAVRGLSAADLAARLSTLGD